MTQRLAFEIDGRVVPISNPERVVWPLTGFRKRDLLDYYLAVAPALLRHLAGRAVMLWRFPEGVDGPGWFQANCRGAPSWVRVHEMVGRRGETLRYCLVEEPATLAWLANMGTIEVHPFLWRVDTPAAPTALMFDLDPGPPAGLAECARVAVHLRDVLGPLGPPVVKTSGAAGLHVALGLAAGQSFDAAKAFARGVAARAATELPELVVGRIARAERAGRVWIDWVQADARRQTIAAWSLRATPVPLVSAPVAWAEVEAVARGVPASTLRFGPAAALDRLERLGDPFAPALDGVAILPPVAGGEPRPAPAGEPRSAPAGEPRPGPADTQG